MFTHYRTQGVVLKSIDRSEADKLLIAYTEDFGRIEIVARGARKIVSKLRPAIEFKAIIELEFIQGKACKTLTDVLVLDALGGYRREPGKDLAARNICSFAERILMEQQQDPAVWSLLKTTLIFLKDSPEKSFDAISNYFVWHLFEISGWRPELSDNFSKPQEAALARFFRDANLERASRVRLTEKQARLMDIAAERYFDLVTK